MRAFEISGGYFVRLDRGEELMAALTRFAAERGLQAGAVSGIGAVMNTTLGYFDVHAREYRKQEFPDDMELVSLTGNVSRVDGEPLIHAHALLAGPDFVAVGGHLFAAEIAVTGEIFIHTSQTPLQRELDEHTGLKLIAD